LNTVVGRYSSIGANCSNVGFRHPIESVSMSSAVFNFSRENIAGYLDLVELRDGARPAPKSVPAPQPQLAPIIIGNDVWIGSGVTISGGVTIGDGAIIAGNSIVTKSVRPYEIVAGIPAKFKRYRFPKEIVDGLIESKWWDFELSDLYDFGFSDPEIFLKNFTRSKGDLRSYSLRSIKLADVLS
jgi:virginiamycin A acetyltransferase